MNNNVNMTNMGYRNPNLNKMAPSAKVRKTGPGNVHSQSSLTFKKFQKNGKFASVPPLKLGGPAPKDFSFNKPKGQGGATKKRGMSRKRRMTRRR